MGNLDDAQDTTAPRGKAKARRASGFSPTFRLLFVGHDPRLSPESSIVLAAVAARNGLRCDGAEMEGRTDDNLTHDSGRAAALAWVVRETGLCIGAVRRGARDLVAAGHAYRDPEAVGWSNAGLFAVPAALAARWAELRRRLRFDQRVRSLGMRAEPLLLAGLVLGQLLPSGKLPLGIGYLSERTGLARRTVQRALATAERFGALHKWTAPVGGGQLCIAPGPWPSRSGARERSRSGARVKALEAAADGIAAFAKGGHREVAQPPSQSGATHHRELAPPPSRSGARLPDVQPESHSDVSEDNTLARVVDLVASLSEQKSLRNQQAPASPAVLGTGQGCAVAEPRLRPPVEPESAVQQWVSAFVGKGIEQLVQNHVADVAGLLDQLGLPDAAGDRRALFAERRQFAARVIAWCPSPARLGERLLSVRRAQGAAGFLAGLRAEVDAGGVA
ncbi:MAG: hypothetical protein ACK501_19035 [Planctomycetota bacterium]